MAYPKKILGDYVNIKTGKLDVNAESESGKYPFFTCAREPHAIDEYAYDCECVLVAGNGDLNVKYYEGKFNAYQRTYIIESKNEAYIDVKYLYFFLEQYIERLREGSIGGVIKYIKLEHLTDIEIPLPPLETQKQIAAVLEKADQLRKDCQRVEQELNALAQSVFLEMFGDPEINPKGWMREKLSNLVDGFKYGSSEKSTDSGVPILRIPNVIGSSISEDDLKYIKLSDKDVESLRLNKGDLLFVRSNGNKEYIGRSAVFDLDGTYVYASYLIRCRPDIKKINPYFAAEFLRTLSGRNMLMAQAKTTAGQYNINTNGLGNLELYVPPLAVQKKFEEVVSLLRLRKLENNKLANNYNALFNSLLQQAFKGELEFKEMRKAA